MILNLICSEVFRLLRRRMPLILLLILAAIIAGLYGVFWAVLYTAEQSSDPEAALRARDMREALAPASIDDLGLGVTQTVGTVMVIILTASTVAGEFGWGTIRTLLPRTPGRAHFLAAKLLTMLGFGVVVVALGAGVAVAVSYSIAAVEDLPRDLGSDSPAMLLGAILITMYVTLPYLLLTFVLSLWFRSTAAGIGITLPVLFVEGIVTTVLNALDGIWQRIAGLLISENVGAVMALGTPPEDRSPDLPDPWQGAVVLAVYSAVFIVLSFWRFQTRDITSG